MLTSRAYHDLFGRKMVHGLDKVQNQLRTAKDVYLRLFDAETIRSYEIVLISSQRLFISEPTNGCLAPFPQPADLFSRWFADEGATRIYKKRYHESIVQTGYTLHWIYKY